MSNPRIIYVASIDADGCLFNLSYEGARQQGSLDADAEKSRLLERNKGLIKYINATIAAIEQKFNLKLTPEQKKMFVGSARQSKIIDDFNRWNNGTDSIFTALLTLSKALGFSIEKYLLSDTYNNLEANTAFDSAIGDNPTNYRWLFDTSKVSILYAQMHKVASENSDALIIFDFFDDRIEDILPSLSTFFSENPHLVPKNVMLRLNHYQGGKVTKFKESLLGKEGEIDKKYNETVRAVAQSYTGTSTIPGGEHNLSEAFKKVKKQSALETAEVVASSASASSSSSSSSTSSIVAAIVPEAAETIAQTIVSQQNPTIVVPVSPPVSSTIVEKSELPHSKEFDNAVNNYMKFYENNYHKSTKELQDAIYNPELTQDEKLIKIIDYQNFRGTEWGYKGRTALTIVSSAIDVMSMPLFKDFNHAVAELKKECHSIDDERLFRETTFLQTTVCNPKLTPRAKLKAIQKYQDKWEAKGWRWFARAVTNVIFTAIGAVVCGVAGSFALPVVGTCVGIGVGGSLGLVVGEAICRHTFFALDIAVEKVALSAMNKLTQEFEAENPSTVAQEKAPNAEVYRLVP